MKGRIDAGFFHFGRPASITLVGIQDDRFSSDPAMTSSTDIICHNCDTAFAYTDADRDFRETRGRERPTLCPDCPSRERRHRNNELIAMDQRADSFDPFIVHGEPRPDNRNKGRDRGARQQYSAICAACNSETRVPFIPRGDRPVYCRSCYNARKGR